MADVQEKTRYLISIWRKNGLIHSYETELLAKLRNVYYGGVPASIVLLSAKMCNGHCYDRALLITFGFGEDEFRLVDADIDSIRLNPKFIDSNDPHYGNHCFAERLKSDGTTWVYDTTTGLVYEKNLYYRMEHPIITKINNRQAVQAYCEYQDIKSANPQKDKYALPIILPNIEEAAEDQKMYREALMHEIDQYKKKIDYDGLCREVEEDMQAKGFNNDEFDDIIRLIFCSK